MLHDSYMYRIISIDKEKVFYFLKFIYILAAVSTIIEKENKNALFFHHRSMCLTEN